MMELSEKLAEILGVSGVSVRIGMVVCLILLIVGAVAIIWTLLSRWGQRMDYKWYQKEIPEVMAELEKMRLKAAKLERDIENYQTVIEKKVLSATITMDAIMSDEDARWLVEICQKIDTKKMREKLKKKRAKIDEYEEWLTEARKNYTALSEKFGGM